MSVSKKQRAHKVSRGEVGARKHPLTEIEKILMGKGLYQSLTPAGGDRHSR